MTPTEATTMAALLGGPAALGVAALLGYARGVLSAPTRDPGRRLAHFGVGAVLVVWFVVFLLLSTGDLVRYWTTGGRVAPEYVALTVAWVVGIGLLAVDAVERPPGRSLSLRELPGRRVAATRQAAARDLSALRPHASKRPGGCPGSAGALCETPTDGDTLG